MDAAARLATTGYSSRGGESLDTECFGYGSERFLIGCSDLPSIEGETDGQTGDSFAAFSQRLRMGRLIHDECARSASALDEPVSLQFAVGACNGAWGQIELLGEIADCRKALSGLESTDCHHH